MLTAYSWVNRNICGREWKNVHPKGRIYEFEAYFAEFQQNEQQVKVRSVHRSDATPLLAADLYVDRISRREH